MARLEEIVTLLERGDAPLDQAMSLFEEGAKLLRECTAKLDTEEQQVRLLVAGEDGQPQEVMNRTVPSDPRQPDTRKWHFRAR